jgi:hypothetical protein
MQQNAYRLNLNKIIFSLAEKAGELPVILLAFVYSWGEICYYTQTGIKNLTTISERSL